MESKMVLFLTVYMGYIYLFINILLLCNKKTFEEIWYKK